MVIGCVLRGIAVNFEGILSGTGGRKHEVTKTRRTTKTREMKIRIKIKIKIGG